jgi:hypothetical protein
MGAGLTVKELADLLDPPVTAEQVWHLVCYTRLKPCGYRRTGQRGRPTAVYDARIVMKAHALLAPLVAENRQVLN